ncbi:class I SAM-dependent methyltransferase [Streptomyces acidiscabies]|uniref:class I SAM-dependent methyltransferase n=1 Tax=Streptomyces acidiscabies TaxID=42234 RepID=UPI000953662B|nr:class I SAM-dependent methyltransferase [Streptomyces acidiscabies]
MRVEFGANDEGRPISSGQAGSKVRSSTELAHWDDWFASGRGFRDADADEVRRLVETVADVSPRRALDVGCGLGAYAAVLASLGWDTLAVDWAESAVAAVRDRYAGLQPRLRVQRLDFSDAGAVRRSLPRRGFGLVTMRLALAFLPDKAEVGELVRELLVPGGVWVVTTPLAGRLPDARRGIGVTPADVAAFTEGWGEGSWYDLEGGVRCFVLR